MQKISLFPTHIAIPHHHQQNFKHLYYDIAWFGLINGSFIAFSSVYLTRIGASTFQLGLYAAAPAVGALLFSLSLGWWLRKRSVDRTVFWSAVLFRLFYLVWLPLPILFQATAQINVVLWATLLFSGPGTLLAIGFNAMFADVVPPAFRHHVLGIRQGLLAVSSIFASLVCGYLLNSLPFPLNYQIVFGIGGIGAVMSTVHLWFIRTESKTVQAYQAVKPLRESESPGVAIGVQGIRPPMAMRYFLRRPVLRFPRVTTLRGEYGRIMLLIFFFFLALYTSNPIYYPYWVDELNYSDQLISFGTAGFYIFQLIGSLQLARIGGRLGNKRTLAIGAAFLSAYPGLSALFTHPIGFMIASSISGLAWGLAGGVLLSYILEAIPTDQRPRYMAWYSFLTNLAILLGSFLGPQIASWLGLRLGLGVSGIIRLISGVLIGLFGTIRDPQD